MWRFSCFNYCVCTVHVWSYLSLPSLLRRVVNTHTHTKNHLEAFTLHFQPHPCIKSLHNKQSALPVSLAKEEVPKPALIFTLIIPSLNLTLGLARTVYIHRIWPCIWWFPCQKYRTCTVYVWFWPTLLIDLLCTPFPASQSLLCTYDLTCPCCETEQSTAYGVYQM